MMKQLQFVTTHHDNGGRRVEAKRKADKLSSKTRSKRSRFRLHRTNVSKRIGKVAEQIKSLKSSYLCNCPFVGIIIDEGNNWSRSCPVYTATITCDNEFRWRIQFVGQADCQGNKTGEGIFTLVKQIFVETGLEVVYKKITAAGTDGASAMRSTQHFRGKCFCCY